MLNTLFLLTILSLVASYKTYAYELYSLLLQMDNALWVVNTEGDPVLRLTYGGTFYSAATWSPDRRYGAFSPATRMGDEKAIIIVDKTGKEIAKIIVDPANSDYGIRYIDRIAWETPTFLWSHANVGPNGGYIDIWKLDPSWRYSHEKRIGTTGFGCELSPNKNHVACVVSAFDADSNRSFHLLKIYDASKKEHPDSDTFFDSHPRVIELPQVENVDKIRFTPDGARLVILGGSRKFLLDIRDNRLSEIKEVPQGM